MAEAPETPKEVNFLTEMDKDYRIVPTNGVWVGSTTKRDMTIDFFIEQVALPDVVTHSVGEDGRLTDEIRRMPAERKFVRKYQIGVIMTEETAESLAKAIMARIDLVKKIREVK